MFNISYLENWNFQGIVIFQGWISRKFPFCWYICCWGLKRKIMLKKRVGVGDLMIFRDVSIKIFNNNESNSILTKFRDFIINLMYVRFIYIKCSHGHFEHIITLCDFTKIRIMLESWVATVFLSWWNATFNICRIWL